MALNAQIANTPSQTDFPCVNMQAADIPANAVITVDAANAVSGVNYSTTPYIAVKYVAALGATAIGVTNEILKAVASGQNETYAGSVRLVGPTAWCTATGTITAGGTVMADTATPGNVIAQTAAKAQLGIALTTAATGEPVFVLLCGANNA